MSRVGNLHNRLPLLLTKEPFRYIWLDSRTTGDAKCVSTLSLYWSSDILGYVPGVMAKSHAMTGLASWMLVAPLLHASPVDPVGLALAFAGSLLPDIDHPASWVGRRSRPLSTAISRVFGHRGITHSALATVALVALLNQRGYPHVVVSAACVGYLSHLTADMLSPAGLRLAWPLKQTWAMPVYRTGAASEAILVAGFCVLAGWVLLQRLQVHGPLHALHLWVHRVLLPGR